PARGTALGAAVVLGLMWAAWHLPVVDFLGAAHPHGAYWLPFFIVFAADMIAMRVLISWIYVNTASLLAAQLMHVSSTAALVVFASPRIDARQEVASCAGTLAPRGRDRSRIWHGIETARGRYLEGDARNCCRGPQALVARAGRTVECPCCNHCVP